VCEGFCSVFCIPSPNDHCHPVGAFVEVSVHWTVSGAVPDCRLVVNEEMGAGRTSVTMMYPAFVVVLLPAEFETPRETAYVPVDVNVYTGFWMVEVPPSPKVQYHPVGTLVEESVNWTVRGLTPEVTFDVNDDTGIAAFTIIYPVCETVLLPAELVTVRVTV
jgi:hypothetical protein